jgi:hypothetical protein
LTETVATLYNGFLIPVRQIFVMSDYKRPNFDGEWWEKISAYLEENPEEGFESDQVKEFIKFVVNKYVSGSIGHTEQEILDKLQQMQKEN